MCSPGSFAFVSFPGFVRRGPGNAPSLQRHRLAQRKLAPASRSQLRLRMSAEPVEDGVRLPSRNREALDAETAWLAQQVTSWLDAEWDQGAPQPIHADIGARTAQIYARQRMEGEDDLASVLLAVGGELEAFDFTAAFVNAWSVANKTAELLIAHCAGPRVTLEPYVRDPNALRWSPGMGTAKSGAATGTDRMAAAPSLADKFERYKFLRDLLDGTTSKELVNGAVALAAGYRCDVSAGTWDAGGVDDAHFRAFGAAPPDVLGDEDAEGRTATLDYMAEQLEAHPNDALDTVIDAIHGIELSAALRKDPEEQAFQKREVVAKWLHCFGGF